jgi:uncharacterized protein (TIGR03437 family)
MRGRRTGTFLTVTAAMALLAVPSQAYYHYIHFLSRTGPYNPVPDAFDLNALPFRTVTFFASDAGPSNYGGNDSFGAVLSQVKQAAAAWDSVPSSDLRVAFGGLEAQNAKSNVPGGDVVFQDVPPGLLGMGGVTVSNSASVNNGQNGPFVPISRGLVILGNNTGNAPGPVYLDSYFTTAVHEFGHALGLQHTWTSAAMSQDSNFRNTSRARPIDADDMAAISVLYGKAGWAANYGSISGRITMDGNPVALASVVAIPPVGSAVSTLTNPDGTYTIQGLPPNNYLVYAHPLPPDAIPADGSGLTPPADMMGQPVPGTSGAFGTVFFPGTTDPQQAQSFTVTAGAALTNVAFTVQPRASVPLYDVDTYSFLDSGPQTYTYSGAIAISPAFVDVTQSVLTIVAESQVMAVPKVQSVRILGGAFPDAVLPPKQDQPTLPLWFYVPSNFTGAGPRHLVFDFGSDIFVLPEGINLVQSGPPSVSSATPNGDGTVAISGSRLGPDSRVFFDGLRAPVAAPFSGTSDQGSIRVTPPPGASGQVSTITVSNSDGQNSTFWQAPAPPVYTYPASGSPSIASISPNSLAAGASTMVDVTVANMTLVNGQVTLGFGTGDVTVRRVWVLSPTHLVADVVAAPNAAMGSPEVSVVSGFQTATLLGSFQVLPPNPAAPTIVLPVYLYAGGVATVYGLNLGPAGANFQLTVNDLPVTSVLYSSANQINFLIPAGTAPGPAVLKLVNGQGSVKVALQIDLPAPGIQSVINAAGVTLDGAHAANPGDLLTMLVSGLDPSAADRSRLQVTVSGVPMTVQQVTMVAGGQFQIQFALAQSFGGSLVPVVVSLDGSPSAPYTLTAQ